LRESWLATRSFLAEVAKRVGVEFFAQPEESAPGPQQQEHFIFERTSSPKQGDFFTLAGMEPRDRSFPRWGINE
jgi:hypothetical protein